MGRERDDDQAPGDPAADDRPGIERDLLRLADDMESTRYMSRWGLVRRAAALLADRRRTLEALMSEHRESIRATCGPLADVEACDCRFCRLVRPAPAKGR